MVFNTAIYEKIVRCFFKSFEQRIKLLKIGFGCVRVCMMFCVANAHVMIGHLSFFKQRQGRERSATHHENKSV